MKRAPLRRACTLVAVSAVSAVSAVLGGASIVACVSDEVPTPTAAPDGAAPPSDGSTTSPESSTSVDDDASNPPQDAGPDAEDITDGGDLPPEDDGGITDPDGGFDAGPACDALKPGAFVTSTCSTLSRIHAGGALTSGTYQLTNVTVLGTKAFCIAGGGFVPYDHRGALQVTATSATSATFELLDQYRKAGGPIALRPTTVRYDVTAAANAAQLTFTPQECALTAAPSLVSYSVGTLAATGKKTITLRLPYGAKGSANYTFTEM